MTVKELIEELSNHPQESEVFYMGEDKGLISVSSVKEAIPANDETKEGIGEKFVLIE